MQRRRTKQEAGRAVRRDVVLRERDVAGDRRHGVVELMGDPSGQKTNCLQATDLDPFLREFAPFRDVPEKCDQARASSLESRH